MQERFPLTIITPVRNAGAYFEHTLETVSAQTCKDFEYIVLDAVSTDTTPRIIEKYRAAITYTHSRPDKGAVDAFNTGIEMARGDFIAFLSADDWLAPDAVERIVEAAKANPAAEVISFGLTEWREEQGGRRLFLATYRDPDDGVFDVPNALYSPCISRCFRRALYTRHGLYRHLEYGHFADRELQVRFALHQPKKAVIPHVLYHFRKHEASATGNAGVNTIIKSMACNRRIADSYLGDRHSGSRQRRVLLQWYGFAWVRQVFFMFKARQIKQAIQVMIEGMRRHPASCIFALFLHDIPRTYRSRTLPE
jgi:glycosyltransferase involved in cell wall biosynthesis